MSGQLIECPCGTVLRGEGIDDVVSEAQQHAKSVHDMDLTDEQAKAMAPTGLSLPPAVNQTKRGEIMKQFACATVVDGCDGVVTGTTEDEVLAAAAAHAAEAHGMSEVPDEVVAAIRAGITEA